MSKFHIVPDKIKKEKIKELNKLVDRWHTASYRTKKEIIRIYKINPQKITVIPLGVNLKAFKPVDELHKNKLKYKLLIRYI